MVLILVKFSLTKICSKNTWFVCQIIWIYHLVCLVENIFVSVVHDFSICIEMFDHETFKYAHFVGTHRMPFCLQQPLIELKDLLQLAQCTFWKSSPRKKEFTVFQTDGWNRKKVFAEFSATDLYILVFQGKMEVICGMESRFHQADENWIYVCIYITSIHSLKST